MLAQRGLFSTLCDRNTYRVTLLGLFCRRDYQYRPRFHTETRRAQRVEASAIAIIKSENNSALQ